MIAGGASSQPASPGNTPLSEDQVKIQFDNTHIVLDGRNYARTLAAEHGYEEDIYTVEEPSRSPSTSISPSATSQIPPARKRKRPYVPGMSELGDSGIWTVRSGQWRLRVQSANNGKSGIECVLVAVKIEAYTSEMARNEARFFLGG
jgi:hypothetical protein